MLAPLFRPDLSPEYLAALALPMLETILLTVAAMALAIPGGIAIGLITTLGGKPGRWFGKGLTAIRAVPELTLAIICVIFFGLGPPAALVAIGAYYLASTGKVFADFLSQAQRSAPATAIARTGAGKTAQAVWALLPVSSSQMLAYGGFAFECALRASVVVGAVGGGGIGGELVSVLASFDLHRASTCILATIVLVMVTERCAHAVCRHPRWLWPILALGLAYATYLGPVLVSPGHGLRVVGEMLPPTLTAQDWQQLPGLVAQTLGMAVIATCLAAVLALPLAFSACRLCAPAPLRIALRTLCAALRAVPELIWALILILFVGIGPVAGCLALFIHSLGSLTRLFADSLEAAPPAPRQQLARTGAGRVTACLYGALPPALETMKTHIAFRLEWNMRMATIMGLIGAGGVGQALYEAQQLLFYDRMLGWLIVTVTVLLITELALTRICTPSPSHGHGHDHDHDHDHDQQIAKKGSSA